MAKNARKHGQATKLKRRSLPRTPGFKRTGNPFYDLNKIYGRVDLHDPGVRAKIRRDTRGQIEICLGMYVRMVPGARIELATPAFSGRRSTNELPRPLNFSSLVFVLSRVKLAQNFFQFPRV